MSEFTSFALLSLWNVLGVPSTKIPADGTTFASYVLPPVVCYFILAVLAVTPQTHAIRVALWPLIALLALRAVLSVNISHDKPDTIFISLMFHGVIRSIGWTLGKEPLVRHLRPGNSSPSTIMDALDLATAFRGHGWEWSRRLYIPRETRPANRLAFVFHTFPSVVAHALICGVFHRAVLSLVFIGVGNNQGSTLFDETLPFPVRYLRASIISIFTAIATYAGMRTVYDLCTILAIILLGQDHAQWPPAFDAPWRATSLSDFWGRRWHQFWRQVFLLLGGYPLSLVLGRTGIVIGAFLVSGLLHHITLFTFDSQAEMWRMYVGFGMMGVGVLAERAFQQVTGRRVGGMVGWVWTMAWLILWGNVIFEGFARAPMHDRSSLIDSVSPVRVLVEGLAMGFDDWLHAS
ncbi:hypothetical protein OG21DRAFT_1412637 [Imleria badia]|nr:hypothetical protein OG21DRAFT_1412637 [Imleria badia]